MLPVPSLNRFISSRYASRFLAENNKIYFSDRIMNNASIISASNASQTTETVKTTYIITVHSNKENYNFIYSAVTIF